MSSPPNALLFLTRNDISNGFRELFSYDNREAEHVTYSQPILMDPGARFALLSPRDSYGNDLQPVRHTPFS